MDDYAPGYKLLNSFFDQERIAGYKPGVYHPVSLGDRFKGTRYEIYHKLGWGGHSTVWLAKDTIHEEWVALKILIALTDQEKASNEIRVLRDLNSSPTTSESYAIRLLDEFYHEGPNGRHRCLVFEFLGPSLGSVIASSLPIPFTESAPGEDRMDPWVTLQVSKQLLSALKNLHEKGIAHGDISSNNIVFTVSNLLHASEEEFWRNIGRPVVEDLVREDGQPVEPRFPKHIVRRAEWNMWVDEDEEDIRLIDWGESFRRGEEPATVAQPIDCKAPETIFTDSLDHRIDLWTAGIVIYQMIFGQRPFGVMDGDAGLVLQMIHFIEDLPDEWKDKWMEMKDEYVKSRGDDAIKIPEASSLEKLFDDLAEDPLEPPLRPLLPVIQGLMRFRPSDRLSASEALELLSEALDDERFKSAMR